MLSRGNKKLLPWNVTLRATDLNLIVDVQENEEKSLKAQLSSWHELNTSYDKVKKAIDGDNKNPDRLFSYMFRPIRGLYLLSYFVTSPGRLCCNFWFASRLAYDKIKDYSALFCFSRLFSPVGIDMEAA